MHCEHSDCKEPAAAIIHWPSLPPIGLCELHFEAAKGVAIAQDVELKSTPVDK